MDMDMDDADRDHASDVTKARDGVLRELRYFKNQLLNQGAPNMTTDERESIICTGIYNLGNVASPETRMGDFLPSTAQFVEEYELGSGDHGVVVKARDSVTGETVALKTLHPKPLYYAEDQEDQLSTHRILREACFMAACRGHSSLVNLSAVGRDPLTGKYCLVMEHVGPTLSDVLQYQRGFKPFPEREVRRIMRQVLSGAKVMHERCIVHRAINSTNIFVGDGGKGSVVKIGDYGEASSTYERLVQFGALLSHLAPECLVDPQRADNNNEAMDLWSMGCLMLELLTGHDQFEVEPDGDTLQRIDDVLGFSDKEIMESVEKPAVDFFELPPEVQRYRVQWRGTNRLRELVPRELLSDDGFKVLQGLLMHCPRSRIKAAQALQLPWFTRNTDDSDPTVSISCWVYIGALAFLFLTVFAFLIRRWC